MSLLSFFSAEEMNKADEELRETIKKLWPFQSKKMLNLLVAPAEGNLLRKTENLLFIWVFYVILLYLQFELSKKG